MPDNTFQPLSHTFQFQTLSPGQIETLNQASFEILERTGVRFYHPEALDLLRSAGAVIEDQNLVKIPLQLVERFLKTAPGQITIYNQLGEQALVLGEPISYFGVGSDCPHVYDLDTGLRRKAVLDDVRTGIRLVDALPHLDFVMSMFLPSDIPEDHYERHQLAVMFQESTKPVVYVGLEGDSTRYAIEMASAVAGGLPSLARTPFIINYVNTVSPLQHNQESVQRLLTAAEHNLPTIYAPGNIGGMTSPITPAGQLALGNAGQLAGLVLSQLKREGSPFIRSNPSGGCLDMHSMVNLYSAPDCGPIGWDVARAQGLPIFGTAGCSDAKMFDAQAAGEAALSLLTNVLGGANLIHDIGYLDSAMTGSLELVVYCNEVISWLKGYFKKPEITEETLALDLIHDIGPDGFFLEAEHTYRHVFQGWSPTLLDRKSYTQWAEEGKTSLQIRANHLAKEILHNHQVEPLPTSVSDQLKSIAQRP